MKILQINTVVNAGSTGHIAEKIGQVVIDKGCQSYIVFGRNPKPSKSLTLKIGSKLDLYWHAILTRVFDYHGGGSVFATKKLIRRISQIDPDIIHLHNVHGYYLNIKILFNFLKKSGKPVVWTFHDCWAFTGHCCYYMAADCNKWQVQCSHCPEKKQYPKSVLFDNSKNNFNLKKSLFTQLKNLTIVTPSQWLATQVRLSFLQKNKIVVINNGIDLDIFKPSVKMTHSARYLDKKNKFIILGVANVWDKRKGLDDFIRLAGMLNDDEIIVLIGLNRKQLNKLPANIIGLQRTENQTALAEWYCNADVFVNLTYEDNFPTVNIEAIACGTPVITYNSGGAAEITDDSTGISIDRGDIYGIKNAINIIKNNGKRYYSDKCRHRAMTLYNDYDKFTEYIELYENILKG